jgi:hypothetical protein
MSEYFTMLNIVSKNLNKLWEISFVVLLILWLVGVSNIEWYYCFLLIPIGFLCNLIFAFIAILLFYIFIKRN